MLDEQTKTSTMSPRAIGSFTLASKMRDSRTVLDGLRQSGAYKLLFPRPNSAALNSILVNTSGGLTGGDRFSGSITVGPSSHLRLTTQAAERAYKSQPNQIAKVEVKAHVAAGARLDWLPQETILFDRSALRRHLRIDLEPGARALLVEPLIFGRAAMGEALTALSFHDRITLTRAGVPLYMDAIALSGDVAAQLARPATLNGARAVANVVLAAPEAEGFLQPIRALLSGTGGVSLIEDGLLALRLVGRDGYALRKRLVPVLHLLTQNDLPRSWML